MKMKRSVAVKAAKLPHAAWVLRAYGRYALGASRQAQAMSIYEQSEYMRRKGFEPQNSYETRP